MEDREEKGRIAVRNERNAQIQSHFQEIRKQRYERKEALISHETPVSFPSPPTLFSFLVNMNYAF